MNARLAVISYLWAADERSNLASPYMPDDVERLRQSVARNLTLPHEFICVTDRPEIFDGNPHLRAIPLDRSIPMSAGHCVCRLMTFHPEGRRIFGTDTVFQMDLDTLVVGNLDRIVSRPEDVVLWRNPARVPWERPLRIRPLYNGSFVLHRTGTVPRVWENYRRLLTADLGGPFLKDDQTWLSHCFGPTAPYWDHVDGIYRLAREDTPGSGVWGALPEGARLVTFPGSEGKPDDPKVLAANPWIEEFQGA